MNEPRRLGFISISTEYLLFILQGKLIIRDFIPEDAKYINIVHDPKRDVVLIKIEHESCDLTAQDVEPPVIKDYRIDGSLREVV